MSPKYSPLEKVIGYIECDGCHLIPCLVIIFVLSFPVAAQIVECKSNIADILISQIWSKISYLFTISASLYMCTIISIPEI